MTLCPGQVLYGGLAVDTWDPGSSDLTATASLLGLLLPPAPPPPDTAATKVTQSQYTESFYCGRAICQILALLNLW